MRILVAIFLFLLSAAANAEDPVQAQSPRDATEAELVALVNKVSKSMHACAIVRRNKDLQVSIANKTEDYIDKTPLITAFQKALKLRVTGNKAVLQATLSSAKSVKDGKFESVYTIDAKLLQNGKKFCEKSESFTKSGDADKR